MPLNMNTVGTGTGISKGNNGGGISYGEYIEPIPVTSLSSYNFTSIDSLTAGPSGTSIPGTPNNPFLYFKGEIYCTAATKIKINASGNKLSVTNTNTNFNSQISGYRMIAWKDKFIYGFDKRSGEDCYLYRYDGKSATRLLSFGYKTSSNILEKYLIPYGKNFDKLVCIFSNYDSFSQSTSYFIRIVKIDSNGDVELLPDPGGRRFTMEYIPTMFVSDTKFLVASLSTSTRTIDEYTINTGDTECPASYIKSFTLSRKAFVSYKATLSDGHGTSSSIQNISYPASNRWLLFSVDHYWLASGWMYIDGGYQVDISYGDSYTVKKIIHSRIKTVYGEDSAKPFFVRVNNQDMLFISSYDDKTNGQLFTMTGEWTCDGDRSYITLSCLSGDTVYTQFELKSVSIDGTEPVQINGYKYRCLSDGIYEFTTEFPDTTVIPAVVIKDKNGNLFNTGFTHNSNGAVGAYLIKGMRVNGELITSSGYKNLSTIYDEHKRISITF